MAHPVDPGRRDAIKRAGALAASTLSGCACPMPSWRMGDPPALQPGALAPQPPKEGTLALPLVIDAHCHIFNVEDVPASPFLKGPVAHDLKESEKKLVTALADLLSGIAHFLAPSARAELRMLEELSATHDISPAAARQAIEGELDAQRRKFSRVFSEAAQQPDFAVPYAHQRKAYLDAVKEQARALNEVDELSAESIYRVLVAGLPQDRPAALAFDPAQLFHFAFSLTAPRFLNLQVLQETYRGGHDSPAVDVFCASQVDFNHWLGCAESSTTQHDQVRLLEQIAIMSSGTILPIVAYNPQTDILQDNKSFERVVEAVCKRGFVGVKLYPPMGYRPYGNVPGLRAPTCPVLPDAARIDERLACLYAWCAKHNVPVMAHTSHSFGKTVAEDECGAPAGWRQALTKAKGLRVQGGHFGGDSKFARAQEWAAQYVDMMWRPEGENLFVDVSNLDALLDPDSPAQKVIEPLMVGTSKEIVAGRVIYGSDWYMTQLSKGAGAYLRGMNAYFKRIEMKTAIPGFRNGVLGLNAARLYGLRPGSIDAKETNWDRLTRYYKDKGIAKPIWMYKAEEALPPQRR